MKEQLSEVQWIVGFTEYFSIKVTETLAKFVKINIFITLEINQRLQESKGFIQEKLKNIVKNSRVCVIFIQTYSHSLLPSSTVALKTNRFTTMVAAVKRLCMRHPQWTLKSSDIFTGSTRL